jgi:hypothetical protein
VDIGAFAFDIQTDDGQFFSGKTDNATIRQKVGSRTKSAKITIDGRTVDVTFAKAGA